MSVLEAPRHLLVRLPNPMGDAVMATPALRGLRRALPTSRITWAGRRAALQALDGLPWRDAVMPPTRSLWRKVGPDAVLLLPHAASGVLDARASGARVRVGSGLGGLGVLLTKRVGLPLEKRKLQPRPMTRMYLDLARPFGAEDDGKGTEVVVTAFDRRRAARRLQGEGPTIAVNPGAAFGPSKLYPPDRLGKAARIVRDRTGIVPLVVCGPGEEDLARQTAEVVGEPCLTTHRSPPDVGELKALLQGAAVLLTTDAGPRHLAEALGTPTVVVMGPTDPRWSGDSRGTVVRREDLDCLGCHHERCPIDHPCMRTLEPERVADAALRALATGTLEEG